MTNEGKKLSEAVSSSRKASVTARKKNVIMALLILVGYAALYLLARFLYTEPGEYTLRQWLWGGWQQLDYLFGWLLNQNLFWFVAAVSVVSAFAGKYRFGLWMWFGCSAGLLLGEPLGETPIDSYGHYGWCIWVLFVFISFLAGILTERLYKKHGTLRHHTFWLYIGAAVIAYGWVILDTLLTVRMYTPTP